jgi:hypothetical protein
MPGIGLSSLDHMPALSLRTRVRETPGHSDISQGKMYARLGASTLIELTVPDRLLPLRIMPG